MLIYRVICKDYDYCEWKNEIEAYQKYNALCSLYSSKQGKNNSFQFYGYDHFFHYFFIFAEDALKYLISKGEPDRYQIAEFEISEEEVIRYGGFGINYIPTFITSQVLQACKSKGVEYQTITSPSFEISLPTGCKEIKKYNHIPENYNLMSEEEKELFDSGHYFYLSYLKSTGNIFELGNNSIEQCFRKIYRNYKNGLYKEFLNAYGVTYNDEDKTITKVPIYFGKELEQEKVANRRRILEKYF